ncbi:MAG: hypothetical protein JNK84_17035 [Phreatobacter sp.]|uniref:hypothetical protein n=1 Tax=Phreatobacter sp. TaxID=1966341 RepID=UPI001A4E95A9|nr:hypothetical protein [Phreatobacter sp.]MBL8570778.1 hypothetical protein [Phreatobacter sp.]
MLPAVALVATLAFAFGGADGARAQLQLPGAVAPTPQGASAPSSRPAGPRAPGAEQPGGAVPRSIGASGLRRWEDVLPGRTLRFLGQQGSMVITRAGTGYTITATGVGRRGNDIRNVCTPDLNNGQTVTLKPVGRPQGMARFEAAFPGCTMMIDVLSEVAFVSAPEGACRFADECVVDPTGIWGPGDREIPADREIERARGVAERRLNDARRALQQRLRTTPEGRTFLQEQAGFPANRERVCRNYGTSDIGPGYCQLKYTEARAETLASRLGISTDAPPPAARRPAAPRPAQPRPPAPAPASAPLPLR